MCSPQTKHRLHNTNRIIIATLTTIGLLMDGYQLSDAIFELSVVIWIWLPECDQLEQATIDKFSFAKPKKPSGTRRSHTINERHNKTTVNLLN